MPKNKNLKKKYRKKTRRYRKKSIKKKMRISRKKTLKKRDMQVNRILKKLMMNSIKK